MAHGLALRMKDILEHQNTDSILSEERTLTESWIMSMKSPKNLAREYVVLLRNTLLLMFSPKWLYCKKSDLIYAFKEYHRRISQNDKVAKVYEILLTIVENPWRNKFFCWEELYDGRLSVIKDKQVQEYFELEPEDIVLARVHTLYNENRKQDAMSLARASFLYHSRIRKSFKNASSDKGGIGGHSTIDWYILTAEDLNINDLIDEVEKLKCCERTEILYRLWRKGSKNIDLRGTLIKIFIMIELTQSTQYCCTKHFFRFFCLMHKETQSHLSKIVEDAHVLISQNAPTSAHFYLFVDVFHKHYGMKCIELIIEFYVRGLTIDINHLENKRHSGAILDVNSLEIHIANTFIKLSSLFFKLDLKVARECIFSAFSLRPTPKRLAALKYLAQKLRDSQNSDSNNFSTDIPSSKTIKSDGFTHPILIDGIKNVSDSILHDFVTVLENVRDIKFQYNVFDWKNINELDNYLKLHEVPPNESDVEISNDEIYDVDPNDIVLEDQRNWIKKEIKSVKNDLGNVNESSLIVNKVNIEEQNSDEISGEKTMKKPNVDMNILSNSELNTKSFNENLENVIRKSLTGNSIKSQSTVSSLPEESLNQYVNTKLLPSNEQRVNNEFLYSSPTEGVNRNVLSSIRDEKHADMNQKNIENPNFFTHSSSKNNPESLTASLSDQTKRSALVIQENQITGISELDVQKQSMPETASKLSNTLFQPVHEMHPKSTRDLTQDMRNQTNVVNSSVIAEKKNSCSFQSQNSHLAFSQPLSESFLKDKPVSLPSTNVKAQGVITITPSEARKIIHDKNSVIQHTKHTSQIKERPQIRSHSPNQPLYHCKLPKHNGVNSNLIIPEKPNYSDTVMTFQSNDNCKEGTLTIPNINISSSVIISNQSNRTLPSNTEASFHTQSTNSIASSAMKNIYHRPALQSTLKTKSHEDLSRQRKIDHEKQINSPVMKSQLSFHGFSENKCQATVTSSGLNYSNNQQHENNLLDSTKYQWLPTNQPCSPINNQSSQFHPSHDAHISESWCVNPYSKTVDMPSDKISTYSHSHSYDSISNDTNSTSSQSILKTKLTSSYNSQRNYSHSNVSISLQMKNTNDIKSSYQQFVNVSSPSSIVSVNSTVNPPRTEYNSSLPHGSIFSNDRETAYSMANVRSHNDQISSNHNSSQMCHSTFEVDPHENCSSTIKIKQLNNEVESSVRGNQFLQSRSFQGINDTGDPQVMSKTSYPNSLMKTHIDQFHPNEVLNGKRYVYQEKVSPKQTSTLQNTEIINSVGWDSKEWKQINTENSNQIFDQFLSLMDNSEQSFYKPTEDASISKNSQILNMYANEQSSNAPMSGSLSEMLREVDFSNNLSSNFGAMCDRGSLDYDIIEGKPSEVETFTNDRSGFDKSLNNLSLDSFSNNTNESKASFKISEYGNKKLEKKPSKILELQQKRNVANDLLVKQNHQNYAYSGPIFETDKCSKTVDYGDQNIQAIKKIDSSQGINSALQQNNFLICPVCKIKLSFDMDMQQHINMYHSCISQDLNVKSKYNSQEYIGENSKIKDKSENERFENISLNNSTKSFNNNIHPSQVFEFDPNLYENISKEAYKPLPKGRSKFTSNPTIQIKTENDKCHSVTSFDIPHNENKLPSKKKSPTVPCQYCGKILTENYMKQHILKKHSEHLQVPFNSDLDQTVISSSNSEQNKNFPHLLSKMLQEDVDTSTCLSPSDALHTNIGVYDKPFHYNSSPKAIHQEEKFQFYSSDNIDKSSELKLINKQSSSSLHVMQNADKKLNNFHCETNLMPTYKCHVCDKKYTSKANMIKHMNTSHQLEDFEYNIQQNELHPRSLSRQVSTICTMTNSSQVNSAVQKMPISVPKACTNETIFPIDSVKFCREERINKNCVFSCSDTDDLINSHNRDLSGSQMFQSKVDQPYLNSSIKCVDEQSNPGYLQNTVIVEKNKKIIPKKFKCQVCERGFSYEKNLLKHLRNQHSIDSTSNELSSESSLQNFVQLSDDAYDEHSPSFLNVNSSTFRSHHSKSSLFTDENNDSAEKSLSNNQLLNSDKSEYSAFSKKLCDQSNIFEQADQYELLRNNSSKSFLHNKYGNDIISDNKEKIKNTLPSKLAKKQENESFVTWCDTSLIKSPTNSSKEVEKKNMYFDLPIGNSSENSFLDNEDNYSVTKKNYDVLDTAIKYDQSNLVQSTRINANLESDIVANDLHMKPKINRPEIHSYQFNSVKEKTNFDLQRQFIAAKHNKGKIKKDAIEQYSCNTAHALPFSSVNETDYLNATSNSMKIGEIDKKQLTPDWESQSQRITTVIKSSETMHEPNNNEISGFAYVPLEKYSPGTGSCSVDNYPSVSSSKVSSINNQVSSNENLLNDKNDLPYEKEYSFTSSPDILRNLSVNEASSLDSLIKDYQCGDDFDVSLDNFYESSNEKTETFINAAPNEKDVDFGNAIKNSTPISETFFSSHSPVSSFVESFNLTRDSFIENESLLQYELENAVPQVQPIFGQDVKLVVDDIVSSVSDNDNTLSNSDCHLKKDIASIYNPIMVKVKAFSDNPLIMASDSDESNCRTGYSNTDNLTVINKISVNQGGNSDIKILKAKRKVCRLCYEEFQSMKTLSRHLKSIHKVPLLRKPISNLQSKSNIETDELSPPPLSLHSNYDSDSVSTSLGSSPDFSNLNKELNTSQELEESVDSIKSINSPQSSTVSDNNKNNINCTNKNLIKECISPDVSPTSKRSTLPKYIIRLYRSRSRNRTTIYTIDESRNNVSTKQDAQGNSTSNDKGCERNSDVAIVKQQINKPSVKYKRKPIGQCRRKSDRYSRRTNVHSKSFTASSARKLRTAARLSKRTRKNLKFKRKKSRLSRKIRSYNFPEDVQQFLLSHVQPTVLLTNIKSSITNKSTSVKNSTCSDATYREIMARKPVVRLERLNLTPNFEIDKSKITVNNLSDNSKLPNIVHLNDYKNVANQTPSQNPSSISTKALEDIVKSSVIKDCSVRIEKLAL